MAKRYRRLDASEFLHFVHFPSFTKHWNDIGLDEDDLACFQFDLMENPTAGTVVSGGGGMRKVRFASPRSNKGKSGSARVLYALFRVAGVVLLLDVYAKNELSNPSPAFLASMAAEIAEVEEYLNKRRKM